MLYINECDKKRNLDDWVGTPLKDRWKKLWSAGCEPDLRSYKILLNGYWKKGKVDDALDLLKHISSERLKLTTVAYNTVLPEFFKANLTSDAFHRPAPNA